MFGINHETQRESLGLVRRVEKEHGVKHENGDQGTPFRQRRRVYKRSSSTAMHDEGIERHLTIRKTPQQKGWLKG